MFGIRCLWCLMLLSLGLHVSVMAKSNVNCADFTHSDYGNHFANEYSQSQAKQLQDYNLLWECVGKAWEGLSARGESLKGTTKWIIDSVMNTQTWTEVGKFCYDPSEYLVNAAMSWVYNFCHKNSEEIRKVVAFIYRFITSAEYRQSIYLSAASFAQQTLMQLYQMIQDFTFDQSVKLICYLIGDNGPEIVLGLLTGGQLF